MGRQSLETPNLFYPTMHLRTKKKKPTNPLEAPSFDNNVQPTRFLLRGRASDRRPGESPHLLNDFMVWQSERVRTG